MEVMSLLCGAVVWPILLGGWIVAYRQRRVDGRVFWRVLVAAGLLLTVAAVSMARWLFLDEPLLSAAGEGDVQQVRRLLAWRPDINARDDDTGETPLIRAASAGSMPVARLLVEHGADVNGADAQNWTALKRARARKNTAMVTLLRNAGARQ